MLAPSPNLPSPVNKTRPLPNLDLSLYQGTYKYTSSFALLTGCYALTGNDNYTLCSGYYTALTVIIYWIHPVPTS